LIITLKTETWIRSRKGCGGSEYVRSRLVEDTAGETGLPSLLVTGEAMQTGVLN
jgi:hypothetical protein